MTKKHKVQFFRQSLTRLEKEHKIDAAAENTSALTQLLASILQLDCSAQRASMADSLFEERFVDWNEVRVSALTEIADVFREAGIDEGRARILKTALSELFRRRNELNMDFLSSYKEKQAEDFLDRLGGLPSSIVDEVMLLSLGHSRFPLNRNVRRLCDRLGVLDGDDEEEQRSSLQGIIPKTKMARSHRLFEAHAKSVCKDTPDCDSCFMKNSCQFFERKQSGKKAKSVLKKTAKKKTAKENTVKRTSPKAAKSSKKSK